MTTTPTLQKSKECDCFFLWYLPDSTVYTKKTLKIFWFDSFFSLPTYIRYVFATNVSIITMLSITKL